MLESIIITAILAGCGAGICWLIRDLQLQIKAYEERCESLEEENNDEE